MKLNAIKQIFNIYNKYMMDLDNNINIYTMILNMIWYDMKEIFH